MQTLSSFVASTELGSNGAAPPSGDATTIVTCGERTSYGCANSGYLTLVRGYKGIGSLVEARTRYQPVGFPVSPILEWEVRTKRTFGGIVDVWW